MVKYVPDGIRRINSTFRVIWIAGTVVYVGISLEILKHIPDVPDFKSDMQFYIVFIWFVEINLLNLLWVRFLARGARLGREEVEACVGELARLKGWKEASWCFWFFYGHYGIPLFASWGRFVRFLAYDTEALAWRYGWLMFPYDADDRPIFDVHRVRVEWSDEMSRSHKPSPPGPADDMSDDVVDPAY